MAGYCSTAEAPHHQKVTMCVCSTPVGLVRRAAPWVSESACAAFAKFRMNQVCPGIMNPKCL